MRVAIVGMGGVTTTFRNWPERVIGRALVERGHEVANIAYYDPRQPALSQHQEVVDGIRVSARAGAALAQHCALSGA